MDYDVEEEMGIAFDEAKEGDFRVIHDELHMMGWDSHEIDNLLANEVM